MLNKNFLCSTLALFSTVKIFRTLKNNISVIETGFDDCLLFLMITKNIHTKVHMTSCKKTAGTFLNE